MRILLFSHTFLPTIGGRELVVHHLAESLRCLGHDVVVFGFSGWMRDRHLRFRYSVQRVPSLVRSGALHSKVGRRIREFELGHALRSACEKNEIEVIHAHTTYPTGYISTKRGNRLGGVPVVITPHGVDIDTIPSLGYGLRLDSDLRPRIDWAIKEADALTAISQGIRTTLLRAGATGQRIFDVGNGVDLTRFAGRPTRNIRRYYGLDADSELILSVGNYHPRKGLDLLVRSMQAVIETRPQARLVIVGRGCENLIELINSLGLHGKVVLAGSVPLPSFYSDASSGVENDAGDVLADLYRSGSLYVSAATTEGAEGLSLAVLEAMAAALPVVGTRITGNRDVIKDNVNGFLVSPSNVEALSQSILNVLCSVDGGARLGNNARSLVEQQYSWLSIAKKYLSVYRFARQSSLE